MRAWRAAVRHLESIRAELWKDESLRHKFVVVRKKKIIAVGTNQFDLAREMQGRYPNEVILVTQVEPEARRVELPSLEFFR